MSRVERSLVPWRLRWRLSGRSIVDLWVWQNCLWSLSLEAEFVIGCVVFGEYFLVQWLVFSARNLWSIVVGNAFGADALNILKPAVGSNFWIQFRFMFALQSVSNSLAKSRLTCHRCGQFCASTWVVGGSAIGSDFWTLFRFMFALQSVSNRVAKSRLTCCRCGQFCVSAWVVEEVGKRKFGSEPRVG